MTMLSPTAMQRFLIAFFGERALQLPIDYRFFVLWQSIALEREHLPGFSP